MGHPKITNSKFLFPLLLGALLIFYPHIAHADSAFQDRFTSVILDVSGKFAISFAALFFWFTFFKPPYLVAAFGFFLSVLPPALCAGWLFTAHSSFWTKEVLEAGACLWKAQWILYSLHIACWITTRKIWGVKPTLEA